MPENLTNQPTNQPTLINQKKQSNIHESYSNYLNIHTDSSKDNNRDGCEAIFNN